MFLLDLHLTAYTKLIISGNNPKNLYTNFIHSTGQVNTHVVGVKIEYRSRQSTGLLSLGSVRTPPQAGSFGRQ